MGSTARIAAASLAAAAWLGIAASACGQAAGTAPGRPLALAPPALAADAAPASRWSAELERLDADLRLRLLTPGTPLESWVRGATDVTDIESQVAHYADARIAAPDQVLYQASLAGACLQPTQPVLPACDAIDRLADWARRDQDNGVPEILLADRARRHGALDTMAADLAEAATRPRFDGYWARGALAFWDYFAALPPGFDPAVRAVAAVRYASAQPLAWPAALQGMCANPAHPPVQAAREACLRLGEALMARAGTWTGRLVGVTVAAANAPDVQRRDVIASARAGINQRRAACDQRLRARFAGLESADPAVRQRALAEGGDYIRAQAQVGEIDACDRLAAARP